MVRNLVTVLATVRIKERDDRRARTSHGSWRKALTTPSGVCVRDDCGGVSREAANALAAIGEASVPALINRLTDELHWVRSASAGALGKIGPPAAPATSALPNALDDERSYVRDLSVRAPRVTGRWA